MQSSPGVLIRQIGVHRRKVDEQPVRGPSKDVSSLSVPLDLAIRSLDRWTPWICYSSRMHNVQSRFVGSIFYVAGIYTIATACGPPPLPNGVVVSAHLGHSQNRRGSSNERNVPAAASQATLPTLTSKHSHYVAAFALEEALARFELLARSDPSLSPREQSSFAHTDSSSKRTWQWGLRQIWAVVWATEWLDMTSFSIRARAAPRSKPMTVPPFHSPGSTRSTKRVAPV